MFEEVFTVEEPKPIRARIVKAEEEERFESAKVLTDK